MTTILQRARFFLLAAILGGLVAGAATNIGECQDQAKSSHPRIIMIIRHAEKPAPEKGPDIHLSEIGKERAKLLPTLFVSTVNKKAAFPTPDFLFATHESAKSNRPAETVMPLAMKIKLPIDQEYHNALATVEKSGKKHRGMNALKDELFTHAKYRGKTILISWHHGTTPELAKLLGATNAPSKWGNEVFDRVWQLTYDPQGQATFVDRPQQLMPGDSAK